jgi:hypothetical protein
MTSPDVDLPNPFELPPPAPDRSSRFDPKALSHQRTLSFASLNSRQILNGPDLQQERQHDFNDNASVMAGAFQREGPARYSRIDMLRPKVLIMPAPLQDQHQQQPIGPSRRIREGFEDTPGARWTAACVDYVRCWGARDWVYAQSTVKHVTDSTHLSKYAHGGERDDAFADIEANLQRAEEEGVQVDLGLVPEEPPEPLAVHLVSFMDIVL